MGMYSDWTDEDLLERYAAELVVIDIGVVRQERRLERMFLELERRDVSIHRTLAEAAKRADEINWKIESNARMVEYGFDIGNRAVEQPKKIDKGMPMFGINPAIHKVEKFLRNLHKYSFATVSGDSMLGAGIVDGDMLIVDMSRQPRNNDLVVATIDGRMFVKRYSECNGILTLVSENDEYENIIITEFMNFSVNGVVEAKVDLNL